MVAKTDRERLEAEVRMHRLWGGEGGIVEMVASGKRDPEDVERILQAIKDNKYKFGGKVAEAAEPLFSRDMRKEGWKLLEHTPRRINSVTDLELVPILKSGETYVNGEEMLRRAREEFNANLGQEDAEWLLEHQNEIPKEWRSHYLTFTGTLWRGDGGSRGVSCLHWHGGRWRLDFGWLEGGWGSDDRVLRLRG